MVLNADSLRIAPNPPPPPPPPPPPLPLPPELEPLLLELEQVPVSSQSAGTADGVQSAWLLWPCLHV